MHLILFHMYHPPILSFSFSFSSVFEFFDFVYFSEIFIHGRLNKVEHSLAPPLVSEQGGVWHPLHGFFLLPGHLRGSIEHCS